MEKILSGRDPIKYVMRKRSRRRRDMEEEDEEGREGRRRGKEEEEMGEAWHLAISTSSSTRSTKRIPRTKKNGESNSAIYEMQSLEMDADVEMGKFRNGNNDDEKVDLRGGRLIV